MGILQEIERIQKRKYKENYKFYKKELSNFRTVLKDTNRNLITATQFDYNCMSYALGVFNDWLTLESFERSDLPYSDYYEVDHDFMTEVFRECCTELVMKFAARRLTGPEATLAANERLLSVLVEMISIL